MFLLCRESVLMQVKPAPSIGKQSTIDLQKLLAVNW